MTERNVENGRTHEPSLRELTAEIDGMKQVFIAENKALRSLVDERHDRYKERADSQKVAVDDALRAQKEQTANAFAASEKAIEKSDESQKSYNSSHNDLLRKMDDQHKETLPRPEAAEKFKGIEEKLDNINKDIRMLRESRSEGIGGRGEHIESRQSTGQTVSYIFGAAGFIVALAALFLKAIGH